jgi:predicted Fe-S protein YdhL (DUF1289 family)
MTEVDENEIPSPCVGICCPDENDRCMGCFRTTEEITRWWNMTNNEKLDLLKELKHRANNSAV